MLDAASKKTYHRVATRFLRGSSNGRTADSESAYLGSNPSPRANIKTAISAVFILADYATPSSSTPPNTCIIDPTASREAIVTSDCSFGVATIPSKRIVA